mmetsp:Transcript_6167/g.14218  ORF Transcript_6167/g.14218 Transcript_6167/m.14218 type:complete len:302 (+) Transcript_6167:110-1015(+)
MGSLKRGGACHSAGVLRRGARGCFHGSPRWHVRRECLPVLRGEGRGDQHVVLVLHQVPGCLVGEVPELIVRSSGCNRRAVLRDFHEEGMTVEPLQSVAVQEALRQAAALNVHLDLSVAGAVFQRVHDDALHERSVGHEVMLEGLLCPVGEHLKQHPVRGFLRGLLLRILRGGRHSTRRSSSSRFPKRQVCAHVCADVGELRGRFLLLLHGLLLGLDPLDQNVNHQEGEHRGPGAGGSGPVVPGAVRPVPGNPEGSTHQAEDREDYAENHSETARSAELPHQIPLAEQGQDAHRRKGNCGDV